MNTNRFFVQAIVLAAVFPLAALSPKAASTDEAPQSGFVAELSAGPLVGIDRPVKGCSLALMAGLAFPPFEAGIRAGAAWDAGLGAGLLRFDLEIGLGSGLRAVVGGLAPLGGLALPDPAGGAIPVPVTVAAWPDRFGIASTLAQLPWRVLGAQLAIDVELVYTDYRLTTRAGATSLSAAQALSGAAAFAAGVEATVAVRLRWGGGGHP
jgi:hypothetical protein